MFRIIFDILHGLLPPLLRLFLGIGIPVFIIGVICFVIKLLNEYAFFQMNHKKNKDGDSYQNPSRPDNYRFSEDICKCSNCDHSIRSMKEGACYCQNHQVNVSPTHICDNYHSAIFDF